MVTRPRRGLPWRLVASLEKKLFGVHCLPSTKPLEQGGGAGALKRWLGGVDHGVPADGGGKLAEYADQETERDMGHS